MPYPSKKMTQEDFDKIIEITDNERVWVGDEIAKEYYKDEMPEYGVFPPELYVEVLNKEEVSEIMKYAYEQNIPVASLGAKDLPSAVAPIKTELGFCAAIHSATTSV